MSVAWTTTFPFCLSLAKTTESRASQPTQPINERYTIKESWAVQLSFNLLWCQRESSCLEGWVCHSFQKVLAVSDHQMNFRNTSEMWLNKLLPKAILLAYGISDLCLIRNIELFLFIYRHSALFFPSGIHIPVSAVVSITRKSRVIKKLDCRLSAFYCLMRVAHLDTQWNSHSTELERWVAR